MEDREGTGVKDITGREIMFGDIVEFWTCAFHGIQGAAFKNSQKCGALNRDVICRYDDVSPIPGHKIKTYFAISPLNGCGMYATNLEGKCTVIGTFPEDAKMLLPCLPVAQDGPEAEQVVAKLKSNPLILNGTHSAPGKR